MSKDFPHIAPGQWVYPRHNGYLMACCDCGLVHRLDFRIVPDNPVPRRSVKFRAFRDVKATRRVRRRKRVED